MAKLTVFTFSSIDLLNQIHRCDRPELARPRIHSSMRNQACCAHFFHAFLFFLVYMQGDDVNPPELLADSRGYTM